MKLISARMITTLFAVPLLALSAAPAPRVAPLRYTQTWQTTGRQATSNNTAFANYPGWRYYEHANDGSNVKVSNVGELAMGVSPTPGQYITALITSQTLAGVSKFDLSTTRLIVSVDAGSRFAPEGDDKRSIGLVVGNVTFLIYPGTDAFHVESYNRATTYVNSTLGFIPPTLASDPSPSDVFTHMAVSVLAIGSNYHFEYGIGSYTNTIDIPIAAVGDITSVGLRVTDHGGGYFRNFSVAQADAVPRPPPYRRGS